MPPLILLAAAAAGCYAGFRYLSKLAEAGAKRAGEDVDQTGTKDLGELEWDQTAGVYKPKSRS